MIKNTKNVIGISMSDEVLKVVEIKAGSSPRVNHVYTQDIKGVAPSQLTSAIQQAVKGLKVKNAEVVCMVPPSLTTTKNIEIPSTDKEEIRSIVNLQAGRHTPFSRNEIQIGYINLGVYKTSYTKVLLVIANRTTIKNHIQMYEQAGLKVDRVLFTAEGVTNYMSTLLKLAKSPDPVCVIDVDKFVTNVTVMHNGLPITARSIPVGKQGLAGGASAQSELISELKTTMEAYQNDDIGATPGKYLLTSQDETCQAVGAAIQSELGWTTEISPYVDTFKAPKGILKKLAADYSAVSFLDVIATATTGLKLNVNLVPEEIQLQKSVEAQGREVFKAAVMTILIMFIVGAGLGALVYFKNAELSKLKNNYQEISDEAKFLKKRQAADHIIKSYLKTRMDSLEVLKVLTEALPRKIYLTAIEQDQNGKVNIQGVSDVGSRVYSFGSSLEEREEFKTAEVKSTTAKKDRGKDATAFEIEITLATADDALDEEGVE